MLTGSDSPRSIYFDDAFVTQSIGMIAVVFIPLAGGLKAQWHVVCPVLWERSGTLSHRHAANQGCSEYLCPLPTALLALGGLAAEDHHLCYRCGTVSSTAQSIYYTFLAYRVLKGNLRTCLKKVRKQQELD
jgi:hypothetical protein